MKLDKTLGIALGAQMGGLGDKLQGFGFLFLYGLGPKPLTLNYLEP